MSLNPVTKIKMNGPLQGNRIACITLDLEQDYGDLGYCFNHPTYLGFSILPNIIEFFEKENLPMTCFVQGSILVDYPETIDKFTGLDVEFEVHSFSHPTPKAINHTSEIQRGKESYRNFFGKNPLGYRSPCGFISEEMFSQLFKQGFQFDSSVIPSIRPGVYHALTSPVMPYWINPPLMEFPVAVASPILRSPISLSYQKLLGSPYHLLLQLISLPQVLIFNFHLHDLVVLPSWKQIPSNPLLKPIMRRMWGRGDGMRVLGDFVNMLRHKSYKFSKMEQLNALFREVRP